MPTNFLRTTAKPKPPSRAKPRDGGLRRARVRVGERSFEVALAASPTADVIWRALPLFGIAETWGQSIHFEVPVHAGRDRTARLNARSGEIYYWADDDRIVIVWGETPISRDGEIRLMRPCNVWAQTAADLTILEGVVPGARISIERI